MNAKIYLDPKQDSNGNCQLFFHITGSGTKSKIFSGIKVVEENWSNGRILKREYNGDLKNSILQTKFSILARIIAEAELKGLKSTPAEIKSVFQTKIDQQEKGMTTLAGNHLLTGYLDYYENVYKTIYKHNTIRGIKQVRDHVEKFDPQVTMEGINHTWLVKYCSYLVKLELEDSTIKDRHLKSIKAAAKEALRNGIPVSDQVEKFRWKSTAKQPFFATWEEVQAIKAITEFVLPIQERVRDLFILSCFTGLRESDLREIQKDHISKQGEQIMLRVRVVKTDFDYSIPLGKEVFAILEKYKFKVPTMSQQEYNREIKNIARIVVKGQGQKVKSSGNKRTVKQMERHELYTTHTGRRTFGRRFLDRGGSLIVLSKIMGHKNTETTLRYIGYQPQEVVSEFMKVFG